MRRRLHMRIVVYLFLRRDTVLNRIQQQLVLCMKGVEL